MPRSAATKTITSLACFMVSASVAVFCIAEDWPHWRGVNRNGRTTETSGFDGKQWNIREAWRTSVGDGSASAIVVRGKAYSLGNRRGRDIVTCQDASTGKRLWTAEYDCPAFGRKATGDQGIYRGPSSTPAWDAETGFLYTLSIDGDLHCWNLAKRGEKVWHINLYDEYDPPQRPKVGRSGRRDYGYTTSPLIHGDWVIVEVGGKAGNTVAFDKRTGRQRWASENRDPAGHTGGLVPMTVGGVPCLAVLTHFHLFVMRLDKNRVGETVAAYPWVTEFANSIATPAVQDNHVLITSGYNHQTMCKLQISLKGAKKIWERDIYSKVCSPVIHKGHVYWAWRDAYCLDFETGRQVWKGPSALGDPGSCVVTGEDRLIVWADEGTLLLIETAGHSRNQPQILARRDRLLRTDAWPHVVLADGRLLCKDRAGNLISYAVGD